MAHKKGLGSSRNGRDSKPKMLGVKMFSGQDVSSGMILFAASPMNDVFIVLASQSHNCYLNECLIMTATTPLSLGAAKRASTKSWRP